mmetsp:Transcript_8111/g.16328  ORF Transcript_8111/g.16328 Transcript_8111/m.16328 type:complete len:342 (-) Transcript_8111:430-1455(-)
MDYMIICWIAAGIGIVVAPILFKEYDRRNIIGRREASTNAGQQQTHSSTRLSKEKQAEIRDTYLREKLRPFTRTVAKSDVISNEADDYDIESDEPSRSTTQASTDEDNDSDIESGPKPKGPTSKATTTTVECSAKEDSEQPTNSTYSFLSTTKHCNDHHVVALTEACSDDPSHTELDDASYALDGLHASDDEFDNGRKLAVPCAGCPNNITQPTSGSTTTRTVSNMCAICLSTFDVSDEITWAGNPACAHVFHQSCIFHWLATAGRKHAARERRLRSNGPNGEADHHDVDQITNFPMNCPCCRQAFVKSESNKERGAKEGGPVDSQRTADSAAIDAVADNV